MFDFLLQGYMSVISGRSSYFLFSVKVTIFCIVWPGLWLLFRRNLYVIKKWINIGSYICYKRPGCPVAVVYHWQLLEDNESVFVNGINAEEKQTWKEKVIIFSSTVWSFSYLNKDINIIFFPVFGLLQHSKTKNGGPHQKNKKQNLNDLMNTQMETLSPFCFCSALQKK